MIVVGHGQPEGFETAEGIIPWPDLYDTIASHQPQTAIVLACHAPSDLFLHIYGFDQLVDAEAGGLIVGWYLEQMTGTSSTDDFPFERVARAQTTMKYPLGRYLWFVHGYFGNNTEFYDMYNYLLDHNFFRDHYEQAYFYSYTDFLGAETVEEKNYVHNHYTIDDFAYNLYLTLDAVHDQNTRIDIVAHSMGGLIVRQMLLAGRSLLEAAGITIGSIITLGTPHYGTFLANPLNPWSTIMSLIPWLTNGQFWPSSVFYSMCPGSPFIQSLNTNPLSYSYDIRWFTASGWDLVLAPFLVATHLEPVSDPIVGHLRSLLFFSQSAALFTVSHPTLINDPLGHKTYSTVETWLTDLADSDGDFLTDEAEIYLHGTNPNDGDSDGDTMPDGWEVSHGLNPLEDDSQGDPDNDNLSNSDEFLAGTDPNDSDSDDDTLPDGWEVEYQLDPADSSDATLNYDTDELNNLQEYGYGTDPNDWDTDGDSISDSIEVQEGYDPLDMNNPVPATLLISSVTIDGTTVRVYVNHYAAMSYVKFYAKYKTKFGSWGSYNYMGTDYTPTTGGMYYDSWIHPTIYIRMMVKVMAYDANNNWIGTDYHECVLPNGGSPPDPPE